MAYLIDSDWTIDHLGQVPAATTLFESLEPEGTWISVITYLEAFQGILRASNPDQATRMLLSFTESTPVLPIDLAIAERCARIRHHLTQQGKRPTRRGFDILIAATAIEHDLMLVTRNLRDYNDIPDLKLYTA